MRHGTSLLASLEGMSHTAFRIARELSQAGRSGLTPMFLARKLEIPKEEVEYYVDVHHEVMYTNLTRICLSGEGLALIRRIGDGLNSRGDAECLLQSVQSLSDYGTQQLEEQLDIGGSPSKNKRARTVLELLYGYPDRIEQHVVQSDYSPLAKNIFNSLWESRRGTLEVEELRMIHSAGSVELERALQELLSSYAVFEIFRFKEDGFLCRSIVLLRELRDYRFSAEEEETEIHEGALRPLRGAIEEMRSAGMKYTDLLCRVLASIAAQPCRERKDALSLKMTHGLFKEDRNRLEQIVPEDHDPPLDNFLSAAYRLDWLASVDNKVLIQDISPLFTMSRLERHRLIFQEAFCFLYGQKLYDQITAEAARLLGEEWYSIRDFARLALAQRTGLDMPSLRRTDFGYEYAWPQPARQLFDQLCRFITEEMTWMGLVERGYCEGEPCFRMSALGRAFMEKNFSDFSDDDYPSSRGALIVQPNFEIMASLNHMDPLSTIPLHIFAEAESKSSVGVFRLKRERFVRALQQGHDPAAFLAFLQENNRGDLPETVVITLQDWLSTAKIVRLRTYHVIESEDPMVIAELAHHPRWKEYFTEVDGKKVLRYKNFSRQELAADLEKEGFIIR
ncbi:MAG: hypothetical protein GX130_10395 [Candidatus Hydrogenedens sp.]|jgi:hypothetical protein|nr:hypothetical protein [Candidatus Hydrogenedens sp.]